MMSNSGENNDNEFSNQYSKANSSAAFLTSKDSYEINPPDFLSIRQAKSQNSPSQVLSRSLPDPNEKFRMADLLRSQSRTPTLTSSNIPDPPAPFSSTATTTTSSSSKLERPPLTSTYSYDSTGYERRQQQLAMKVKPPRLAFAKHDVVVDLESSSSAPNRPSSPARSVSSTPTFSARQFANRSKSTLNLMDLRANSASKRRETVSSPHYNNRSFSQLTGGSTTSNSSSGSSSSASGSASTGSSGSGTQPGSSNNMSSKFHAQEKAYLRKIMNDTTEFPMRSLGSSMLLSDVDSDSDDDYDLLPREAMGLGGVGTSFDDEYTDNVTSYPFLEASYNHEEMENDESLPERLEWQAMLASVLTGEVVRSEKRRLKTTTDVAMKEDDLWLEIRARMCGRTFEAQKRKIEDMRANVEATLQEIMDFKVSNPSDLKMTLEEVNNILLKLEYCEQLWQSTQIMKSHSALYRDPQFQRQVEALTTWSTITEWIMREIYLLQLWTGNEAADPTLPPDNAAQNINLVTKPTSLVDRVLKQEDLMKVFDIKIKRNIGPVIECAREGHMNFKEEMGKIGLPVYVEGLEKLIEFPITLIQEIVGLRLIYAKKMSNPTMMLVDQTLEDLSLYLQISVLVKERRIEYTSPIPGLDWVAYNPDPRFDKTILDCVVFFFELSTSKLVNMSFTQVHRIFREIDNFESQYYFLSHVGQFVEGGEIIVACQSW